MQTQLQTKQQIGAVAKVMSAVGMLALGFVAAVFLTVGIESAKKITKSIASDNSDNSDNSVIAAEISYESLILK